MLGAHFVCVCFAWVCVDGLLVMQSTVDQRGQGAGDTDLPVHLRFRIVGHPDDGQSGDLVGGVVDPLHGRELHRLVHRDHSGIGVSGQHRSDGSDRREDECETEGPGGHGQMAAAEDPVGGYGEDEEGPDGETGGHEGA